MENSMAAMSDLLHVRNLQTNFITVRGLVQAVRGISFRVAAGETVGIVGESGCGKTAAARSILRLLPRAGRIVGGEIVFDGEDLLRLSSDRMRELRGNKIAMIFQDPMVSLNPVLTIGRQLTEVLEVHRSMQREKAWQVGIELLRTVGMPSPETKMTAFPHSLSGGMCQRVLIAMALACRPNLIIADEPTTALDVTVQAQILELIKGLRAQTGASLLWISHDLGVIAGLCDRVLVMYAGKIVEGAGAEELFDNPRHPYTIALLASLPRRGDRMRQRLTSIPGAPPDLVQAVTGCSFEPRCTFALDRCRKTPPHLCTITPTHEVACWRDEAVIADA